jgi:hypothetical protein
MKTVDILAITAIIAIVLFGCSPSKSIVGEYHSSDDKVHPYYLKLTADSIFVHYRLGYQICNGATPILPKEGRYKVKADSLYLKYNVRQPITVSDLSDSFVTFIDSSGLQLSRGFVVMKPKLYPSDSLSTDKLFVSKNKIYGRKVGSIYRNKYLSL